MVIGLVVTEIQRPELISFTRETARELRLVYIRWRMPVLPARRAVTQPAARASPIFG